MSLALALALALVLALVLARSVVSAEPWGGFDGRRVNYPVATLCDGSDHSTFRARLALSGDTVTSSTGTLTSARLSNFDVLYTSLANSSAAPLSSSEQAAIASFVIAGGRFIIGGHIFNLGVGL